MSQKRDHKLGSVRVLRLIGRLTLYYGVILGALILALKLFPDLKELLPFGRGAALVDAGQGNSLSEPTIFANLSGDSMENGIKVLFAALGVILVMLPVTWVYLKSRVKSGLDQSLVQTMLLLPVAVAGVVILVQNSLALAFSLAGIVAAVRFRNTLKNTGDSLFIFTAIGAGLAAGVRVLEIAIVVTIVFNYTFLILWDLDYGSDNAVKFMRPSEKLNTPEDPENKEDKEPII